MSISDRWSFAGVDLQNQLVKCVAIDGWEALPPQRGKNIVIPGQVGQRWVTHKHDARRIALGLKVVGLDGRDVQGIFRSVEALSKAFAVEGLQALTHYRADGLPVTAQAQCLQWAPIDQSLVGSLFAGTADFELPDPYFYGSSVFSFYAFIDGITSLPMLLTNPGTVKSRKTVITITGAGGSVGSPFVRLTNAANGAWVQYNAVIGAADTLVIDCGAFTAINTTGGVPNNVIGLITHSGDISWLPIEPGDNTITMTCGVTASTGTVRITVPPAYL